jgi:hypothetical protein
MGAKQSTQAAQKRKKSSQQLQQSNSFQIAAETAHASPQSLASPSKKPSLHGSFYSEYVIYIACLSFMLPRTTVKNYIRYFSHTRVLICFVYILLSPL